MNNYYEIKQQYQQTTFRYAKGKSISEGNEIHPYHEILFYIDGNTTFLSENFKEPLSKNVLLIIPKMHYHKFDIENQNNYTRFVINFPDNEIPSALLQIITDIRIIKNINANIFHLLNQMCTILQTNTSTDTPTFLYSYFLALLTEILIDQKNAVLPSKREHQHLISKCLQYIDLHFNEDIRIETIAKNMNVSISTLFHCFKKEMLIPIRQYVIEKRMIYAHKLLLEGKNPTEIYLECGYNDYSSFYKAYIKTFKHPPTLDKRKIK